MDLNLKIRLSLELASAILLRKKHRKFRDSPLFAAFIGITLSIIPLVLVLEVSDGMISGIMNRYIETFYSHVMLRFYRFPGDEKLTRLEQKIEKLPGVRLSYPEQNGAALMLAGTARSAVQLRALSERAFAEDEGLRKYLRLVSGSLDFSPGSILLASDVAFKLQVQAGDEVALLTGARFGSGPKGKLRPKIQKFTVRGVLSTGYQELDRLWAFISYADAQDFFHSSNSQLLLHIKIDDAFDFKLLQQVMDRIQDLVSPALARTHSWYSQASELQQSYQFTKSILVYIMYLIVAVGTINIASSMVLLVLENSSEIAIMKAFGANKALIRNIYIWVALLVSCIAIFWGTLLGALLSYFINEIIALMNGLLRWLTGILQAPEQAGQGAAKATELNLLDKSYYLEYIPIRLRVLPLLLMGAFVLLMTFVCSIIPALKAANMVPLSILRQNRS